MISFRSLVEGLRSLFHKADENRDLNDELRAYLDASIAQKIKEGMSADEARRAARLEVGSTDALKEEVHATGWEHAVDTFWQDIRFAFRTLRKSPGFTIVAILTLALGIGANTAIFSVVDAVLLKPLPYANSDRIVMIFLQDRALNLDRGVYGDADFQALRRQQRSFDGVAGLRQPDEGFTLTGAHAPQEIPGTAVTSEFFQLLRVQPALGRSFLPGEDRPGQPLAVVVSDQFWREHLRADPSAVGQAIALNGKNYTVVGVMPPTFRFGKSDDQVWPILQLETPMARPPFFLSVVARLKAGVSAQAGGADASRIAAEVTRQYPTSNAVTAIAVPLKEVLVSDASQALLIILGAVGFVLLIAVVNVANLQVARSSAREKEMAIRGALGASGWRLVRQLLTESVMLALTGGALGLAIAHWGLAAIVSMNPGVVPRMHEIHTSSTVLLYTLGASMFAGILFGLTPVFRMGVSRLAESLNQSGRSSTDSSGSRLLHNALVVSEFSLALILLIGAALLLRSFSRLQSVSPGFDPSRITTMQLALAPARYTKAAQVTSFYRSLLDRLEKSPGVQAAGITMSLPPNLLELTNPFHVEGQTYEPGKSTYLAEEIPVSQDYLRALGVPLVAGRFFDDTDVPSRHSLLINHTMARRYFAGKSAVGQRIQTGDADPKSDWDTIVGVVGDVKYEGLDVQEQPTIYVPYTDDGWNPWFTLSMSLVVRTADNSASVAGAVRSVVAGLDSTVPISKVATMDQLLSESVAAPRFRTILLGTFAALALVLAAIGIYGVLAYSVARRTHEIGLRVALGAQHNQVLLLVMSHGARLALFGVATGAVLSLALTRLMSSLLFHVSATDPLTFVGVSVFLFIVALAACWIPARRAMRVDPVVALRHE